MPYSGDLFIPNNRWEDVTQEHKDFMHSLFLKSLDKSQAGLFELFAENILALTPVLGANTFIALYKLGDRVYLFKKCIISVYLVYVDSSDVEFACKLEEFQDYNILTHFKDTQEELFQEIIDRNLRSAQRQIESNVRLNAQWYKFMLGLLRAEDENAFNEAFESIFSEVSGEAKALLKETIKPITIETHM